MNSIISAKFQSQNQFAFKYGTVEIRAKLPGGDWLWPALWMLPKEDLYGWWPASGEIDIAELRGNRNLWLGETHIGYQQVSSAIHRTAGSQGASWNSAAGFVDGWHIWRLEWHPDHMVFIVDGIPYTIWDTSYPFDQQFYLIINLAVGGTGWFPDDANNVGGKPWSNSSPHGHQRTDFWLGRDQWYHTWIWPDKTLQVDYVRVWAY